MEANLAGATYLVGFTGEDTDLFTRNTDSAIGTVTGEGVFVFDSENGDLISAHGAAAGRDEFEWLAFSQDAQEWGRQDLDRRGHHVNPYDFPAGAGLWPAGRDSVFHVSLARTR